MKFVLLSRLLGIFLLGTLFFPQLTSLTISKLILKEASIQNNTHQTEEINVIFHKKCPSCPRLHNTYERTFTISAGQKFTIKNSPHIIKTVMPKNQTLYLNFASHKPHIPAVIEANGLYNQKIYDQATGVARYEIVNNTIYAI